MKQEFDPLSIEVDWHDLTILIVDDVESNFAFLKKALSKTHARIDHASTGLQAIEKCRQNKNIDLVLMDIHLPGISGLEATREIKQFRNDLTVIAQTAFVLSGKKNKCLEAGCDDYIAKPIRADELIAKIRYCLIKNGKDA